MITEDDLESFRSRLTLNSRLKNQVDTCPDKPEAKTSENIFFETKRASERIVSSAINDMHDSIFDGETGLPGEAQINSDYDHFYKNQKSLNASRDKTRPPAQAEFQKMFQLEDGQSDGLRSYSSLRAKAVHRDSATSFIYTPVHVLTRTQTKTKTKTETKTRTPGYRTQKIQPPRQERRLSYPIKKISDHWLDLSTKTAKHHQVHRLQKSQKRLNKWKKKDTPAQEANTKITFSKKTQAGTAKPQKSLRSLASKVDKENRFFKPNITTSKTNRTPKPRPDNPVDQKGARQQSVRVTISRLIRSKCKNTDYKKKKTKALVQAQVKKDKQYYDKLFKKNKNFKFFVSKQKDRQPDLFARPPATHLQKKASTFHFCSRASKTPDKHKPPKYPRPSRPSQSKKHLVNPKARLDKSTHTRQVLGNFSQQKRTKTTDRPKTTASIFSNLPSFLQRRRQQTKKQQARVSRSRSEVLAKSKFVNDRRKTSLGPCPKHSKHSKHPSKHPKCPKVASKSKSHSTWTRLSRKENTRHLSPSTKSHYFKSNLSNKLYGNDDLQNQKTLSSLVYLNKETIISTNHIDNLSALDQRRLLLLREIQECIQKLRLEHKPVSTRNCSNDQSQHLHRLSEKNTISGVSLVDKDYVELWNKQMTFSDVSSVLHAMGYTRQHYQFSFDFYDSKSRRSKEEKLVVQAFKILDGSQDKSSVCLKLLVSFLMALGNLVLGFPSDAEFLGKTRESYRNHLFGAPASERSPRPKVCDRLSSLAREGSRKRSEIRLIKSFLSNLQEEEKEFVLEEEKLILNSKPWIEPHLVSKIHSKFSAFRKNRQSHKNQKLRLVASKERSFVKSEVHCRGPERDQSHCFPASSLSTCVHDDKRLRTHQRPALKAQAQSGPVDESSMIQLERSLNTSYPTNSSKNIKYFSLKICFKKRRPEKIIYSLADDPDQIVEKYAHKYQLNKKKQKKLRDFLVKNIRKNKR